MTPGAILKLIALLTLLIGFADMPYGFYQFERWAVFTAALCALYENAVSQRSENWKTFRGFLFGITALLFNPIFRFKFERGVWQFLDVIALISVAASFIRPKPNRLHETRK